TEENRGNTKASSGDDVPFSNSSSNLSLIKNNGRPLLTEEQVEYTKALSVEYGLPAPEAPDYAKAAQFFDRCDDVEILEAFLANFCNGEDFKTIGELSVAATEHANYLGYQGLPPVPQKAMPQLMTEEQSRDHRQVLLQQAESCTARRP